MVHSTFIAAKFQSVYSFCSFTNNFLRRCFLIRWFYYDIIMWNGTLTLTNMGILE